MDPRNQYRPPGPPPPQGRKPDSYVQLGLQRDGQRSREVEMYGAETSSRDGGPRGGGGRAGGGGPGGGGGGGGGGEGGGGGGGGFAPQESHPAALQNILEGTVKMVSMLNFMKVELGEPQDLKNKEQMRAAGAECLGTLLFVYLGCGSVVASGMLAPGMNSARLLVIALAHGLAIAFLAGATGAISGGHLNPAVTVAFVVAGKETLVRAGMYIGAQLFGGIIGAFLLKCSTPDDWEGSLGSHDLANGIYGSQGFLMEVILTYVLVFVIFGVAVDRRGPGVIAPIPIGFAVVVDHLVGVPYTGASMNPARSFGPAFISGQYGSAHWIYWFGPCFGAAFASATYKYAFLEPALRDAEAREAAISSPATSRLRSSRG